MTICMWHRNHTKTVLLTLYHTMSFVWNLKKQCKVVRTMFWDNFLVNDNLHVTPKPHQNSVIDTLQHYVHCVEPQKTVPSMLWDNFVGNDNLHVRPKQHKNSTLTHSVFWFVLTKTVQVVPNMFWDNFLGNDNLHVNPKQLENSGLDYFYCLNPQKTV